jgi:UDP-3-O-[3-hydroxymyristoyl] glucosamine N-acyltransferase
MRLAELAGVLGCELHGDGEVEIVGVGPIEAATAGEITFVGNPRYARHLKTTRASAVILPPSTPPVALPTLRTAEPHLAFARAIALFHRPVAQAPGIHPTAVVAATAVIGANASVGPYAVVGDGVRIGEQATLGPHVVVYPEVTIGERFVAHAHVTIRERVRIGDDVILHAGVVIGSDGFGYVPTRAGTIHKIPQAGDVVIEDGVEIGANSTVDRAAVGSTIIRRNVKLDNLVMIAHGCEIGAGSMLAAQAGLSGSTRIGRNVMMGGQAGSAGHLHVGDGARVAAQSGLTNDLAGGLTVAGTPTIEIALWRRVVTALPRLPELLRRVRQLEKKLANGASSPPRA